MAWCLAAAMIATSSIAQDLPGKGKTVRTAQAQWETGWFSAEVYRQALLTLGYQAEKPVILDNQTFYQAVGGGQVDLWVNGWFPLHEAYADLYEAGAEQVGYVAKNGALEGYLIDKKTADSHNITNLSDFRKPEIAGLFDNDNDGKADMVGCPPIWDCAQQIMEQLDRWELQNAISPIVGSYSASMTDAIKKHLQGKSILFYTWTPNWTVGVLRTGIDVVWIEAPETDVSANVAGVPGCIDDPCKMGWPANDIRPVANSEFLKSNPAIKALLETMNIPAHDIYAQNARMYRGEERPEDIEKHALEWIATNQDKFDDWIRVAIDAAS